MKKDTPDYPLDAHAHTYTLEPADLDIRTYGVGGGAEREWVQWMPADSHSEIQPGARHPSPSVLGTTAVPEGASLPFLTLASKYSFF